MGLFRPFIDKGLEIASAEVEPSDKKITPATLMTASRPVLAVIAAEMLLKEKRPASLVVLAMGMSDAEGNVARLIDKYFPESGLGTSTFGAELDPIADTAGLLIVSGAALFAPHVSATGKLAVATALGHEGFKAAWAIGKNKQYKDLTGERLSIAPTIAGKESMAEKFLAIGLATLTSDLNDGIIRDGVGLAALTMAATGTIRGESQRRIYDKVAEQMILQASNA